MKKNLLLVLATTALVSSQAFASSMDPGVDIGKARTYYVKAFAGADKLNTLKDKVEVFNIEGNIKLKSKFSPFVGIGFGYYITDRVRTDLTLDFLINSQFKGSDSGSVTVPNPVTGVGNTTLTFVAPAKIKTNIPALLANAYVDVVDVGAVKIFAGAGVGVVKIKAKVTRGNQVTVSTDSSITPAQCQALLSANGSSTIGANGQIIILEPSVSGSSKAKHNFAYALYLGASTEIVPNINAELTYSWKDFGEIDSDEGAPSVKGHNLSVGLRFDI